MLDTGDGERRREHLLRRRPAGHVVHARRGDLTRNQFGHREIDTGEHQQRAQRDQEAGDLGLHHQIPVEKPDRQRDDQRQPRPRPQIQMQVVGQHRRGERTRGHRHPRRQVELAADHQQRHRTRHDPDRRAGVQHRGQRLGLPERRGNDQKENEDRHRTDRRTHLRTNKQALHTIAFLDPFVANNLVTGNVQISLCSHDSLSPARRLNGFRTWPTRRRRRCSTGR